MGNTQHVVINKRQIGRENLVSPAKSPHKLGKVGPKRPRTVATRNLTQMLAHVHDLSQLPGMRPSNVSLEKLLEQPDEKREREDFQSKTFS